MQTFESLYTKLYTKLQIQMNKRNMLGQQIINSRIAGSMQGTLTEFNTLLSGERGHSE